MAVVVDIEDSTSVVYTKARKAFIEWSELSMQARLNYFRAMRIQLAEDMEEIAEVIVQETGKVKTEALTADIMPVLDFLQHLEKHAVQILGTQKKKTPILLFGRKSFVEYMPRGVVLVISPWNYPFQLSMVPLLSALIGGNAVILKPSEVTPGVGKVIENLLVKAGLPKDIAQVVNGDGAVGADLVAGKPDYIFFTGSVHTGKIIQAQAAKDLIPTTLELGGKDPMIVFKDANLDRAVQGAMWGAFTNSGQVCMSVERLYVQRQVYDEFINKLATEVEKLTQGSELNDDLGSMTTKQQVQIVKEQLEDAFQKGAKLRTGLPPQYWTESINGNYYIPPLVLTQVSQDMKVLEEETFGPLLPIIPFDTEEEAISLANSTLYGLNASVWTSDLKKGQRVASKLISGGVVINDVIVTVANHNLPFGGVKNSGLGSYHGDIGLKTFCYEKAVMVHSGRNNSELHWYPYKGKFPLFKKLLYSYYAKKKDWVGFLSSYLRLLGK